MPLTVRSRPLGSSDNEPCGVGSATEEGKVAGVASFWPRAPTAAAPTATPAAPTRKLRRAVVPADPRAYAVWSRGDSGRATPGVGRLGMSETRPLRTAAPT